MKLQPVKNLLSGNVLQRTPLQPLAAEPPEPFKFIGEYRPLVVQIQFNPLQAKHLRKKQLCANTRFVNPFGRKKCLCVFRRSTTCHSRACSISFPLQARGNMPLQHARPNPFFQKNHTLQQCTAAGAFKKQGGRYYCHYLRSFQCAYP